VRNPRPFWILLVGVVAPLLGEIALGFRVPIVVFEVVLGIVIGPHVLGLVQFDGLVEMLRNYTKAQRLPFVLSSAVPSLSITIVITGVGTTMGVMNPDVVAALVGAALLSVLLFPTIAGAMLGKAAKEPGD